MAGLTKQHFNEIAKIFAEEVRLITRNPTTDSNVGRYAGIKEITKRLADYFATQNPLFNKNQFMKACLE